MRRRSGGAREGNAGGWERGSGVYGYGYDRGEGRSVCLCVHEYVGGGGGC